MRKTELLIVGLILTVLAALFCGCEPQEKKIVTQPNIKSLNQQLTPAPQNWKDAYGDTLEAQIVFNLAVLRNNDLLIAQTINKLHPSDPNDPNNLKTRIEVLEKNAVMDGDKFDVSYENISIIDPNGKTATLIMQSIIHKVDSNDPNDN
jgi:hypothetical protein